MKTMTKSALFLAAAFIALPLASASAETTPGYYAGLGAGMNFQNDTGTDTRGVPSFKFGQPGYDVLGNVGYAWSSGLRVEGEAFHNAPIVDGKDGALTNTDLFVNALYDIDLGIFVTPYVGAGVGAGFVGADNIGPVGTGHLNDSSVNLAYQGIAGLALPIDRQWTVTADYRYIATFDPKFSNSAGGTAQLDNSSHNIIFGVRYNFDVPAPVAARATTPPQVHATSMAKPVVAPVPQTFEVFFDFNKSDLTPEAKRIIASAAEEYKGGGFVRIVVTGHTDTMGKAKYNMGLSDRRAAAVKAEFASLGVDASVVVAKGVGKSGLLVPTNDQVREAQNRRAEIVLGKK